MRIREMLKRRRSWMIAAIAVAAVVGGAIATAGVRGALAGETATAPSGEGALDRIEALLRDESVDAATRIERALDALADARAGEPAAPLAGETPERERWSPFSEDFLDTAWEPFPEMMRIREDLDRVIEEAFSRMGLTAPSLFEDDAVAWAPRCEIEEREDAYVYRFDLPGVDRNEVTLQIEDGRLTLEGRRASRIEESNDREGLVRREVRHGLFRRVMALPGDVDLEQSIASELRDGVLTVTLPRRAQGSAAEPRRIEIK